MWKNDWDRTKDHFDLWWQQKGFVLCTEPVKRAVQWEGIKKPAPYKNLEEKLTFPDYVARMNEYTLSCYDYPADTIPVAMTDWGTVCLAALLGAEQKFDEDTVWYKPCIHDIDEPIIFDAGSKWWNRMYDCMKRNNEVACGRYLVAEQAFSSGLDTLAAIYNIEDLMMNLITDRGMVIDRLDEIHTAYEQVIEKISPLFEDKWQGSTFPFFCIWGKGRTSQIQCDSAAMISPAMFEDYAVPYIEKQCSLFDNTMFHLDGTQCLVHIDQLLKVKDLKAIEWTPQAGIEQGGDPRWFDLYKRILNTGKSIQAVNVEPEEVMPMIKALGKNGLYIMTTPIDDVKKAEELYEAVERF